jgi:hypothetical protein
MRDFISGEIADADRVAAIKQKATYKDILVMV